MRSVRQKPPLGSQINWAHPLTRGLVGCWLLNERGRGRFIDSVNGIPSYTSWITSYVPKIIPTPEGETLQNSTEREDSKLDIKTKPIYCPVREISVFSRVLVTASPHGGNNPIAGKGLSGSADKQWRLSTNTLDGAGYQAQLNIGGTVRTLNVSRTPGIGVHTFGFTFDGTNFKMYFDGVLFGSTSAYTGEIGYATDHDIYVGGDGTYACIFPTISFYIYNRAISIEDAKELHKSPYAMFERRPVWMDYVSAATGNRRRRQLIAGVYR